MAKKNKEKNIAKALPRVGSTFAVAMAVTMAMSNQAYATEVVETPAPEVVAEVPVVEAPVAEAPAPVAEVAPAEVPAVNEEIIQSNADTGSDNSDTAADNQEVVDSNADIAAGNAEATGGQLEAPEMPVIPEAPTAPEAPAIEGSTEEKNDAAEEYNDLVGQYNDQVDDFNDAADAFNSQVDEYNNAADAFDNQAQQEYQDFLDQKDAYNDEYAQFLEEEAQRYQDFLEQEAIDKAAHDKAEQEKVTADQEAKAEAQKDHEKQEQLAKEKHEADELAKAENNHNSQQQILKEQFDAAEQTRVEQLNAAEQQKAQQLNAAEQQKVDADAVAKQEALDAYNAAKDAYDSAVEKEEEIFEEVTVYNDDIIAKNEALDSANESMVNDLNNTEVSDIDQVGENNKSVNDSIDAAILETLAGYETLTNTHNELVARGAALDADERRDDELGSETYAAYLEEVKQYNAQVDQFNADITKYNEAVAKYNEEVNKYNATVKDQENANVSNGTETGTSHWGNINIGNNTTFSHIDVKYTAAISKDVEVTTDDNGNKVITESSQMTQYTVTGVYTDSEAADVHAAAKEKPGYNENKHGMDYYGINYKNTASSETEVHRVKLDTANNEFGNPNHSGARLNPATGEISFYVTLMDQNGNVQGLDIEMDSTTVYPDGTYFKAEENDFLDVFEGPGGALEKVQIGDEWYYDISGQSVFVISALTCDGMRENSYYERVNGRYQLTSDGTLNANGLDLVLNLRTLIDIHQAGKADSLTYMNYSLGKTAQATRVERSSYEEYKGEFSYDDYDPSWYTPVIYTPDEYDWVEFDKENFTPSEYKENPFVYNDYVAKAYTPKNFTPGNYEGTPDPGEKDAPAETGRLDYVNKLDKLEELLYYVDEAPEAPDPVVITPEAPTPVVINFEEEGGAGGQNLKNTIKIVDEKIPLAKAPNTGDLSGIWAVISGFSLGGISLLNRKRKEEE